MYADTELMFPYFQNFPQEIQMLDEFCCSYNTNASLTSTISSYNLGGEGDLFKAPEPIIEEPFMEIDPITSAISMISCGENVIFPQSLSASDFESSGQILSEIFYECKNDILAKEGNESPVSFGFKIPDIKTDEFTSQIQKSVSSSCLTLRPNFLDFPVVNFGYVNGMRRSFSEGDMKDRYGTVIDTQQQTLVNDNISLEQPKITNSFPSEDRLEKLSRYRNKKSRRNFGRKIKYACRKALADNQPRIRGRFAKNENLEVSKKQGE